MLLPKIGGHVSAAGGFINCIKNAKNIGAEAIQVFAGSPRRYDVLLLKKEELDKYKEEIKKEKISPVYIHASYLINLASEDEVIFRKSVESIKNSLYFASKIGAKGVVYHPGSPKGGSKKEAINREIKAIKDILKNTPKNVYLIIENTAGIKKIGTDPDEIGCIFQKVNSKRIKVCIDTAHSLESGNIKSFEKSEIKKWILWWKKKVGLENIELLHINDSKTGADSKHDRHANIDEGFIGISGFKNLISFREFKKVPWILEVPGFDNSGPDKKNIDILKKMRSF
jgi:deoxyribonuclease IV